jgi:hypothetical protein
MPFSYDFTDWFHRMDNSIYLRVILKRNIPRPPRRSAIYRAEYIKIPVVHARSAIRQHRNRKRQEA